MKRSAVLTVGACAASVWVAAVLTVAQAAPRSDAPPQVDYQSQIQPIISRHCLECHSRDKRKGGLSLATYGDALAGGRNGAVIRPADAPPRTFFQRLTAAAAPQIPNDEPPSPPARSPPAPP